jgi:hypothetical protein
MSAKIFPKTGQVNRVVGRFRGKDPRPLLSSRPLLIIRSVAVGSTVESEGSSRFAFSGRLRRSGCLSYCPGFPDVVEESHNLRGWRNANGSICVQEGQPIQALGLVGFRALAEQGLQAERRADAEPLAALMR